MSDDKFILPLTPIRGLEEAEILLAHIEAIRECIKEHLQVLESQPANLFDAFDPNFLLTCAKASAAELLKLADEEVDYARRLTIHVVAEDRAMSGGGNAH